MNSQAREERSTRIGCAGKEPIEFRLPYGYDLCFVGPCIRQKLFNLMKPLLESVLLNRTVTYLLPSNLQIAHKRMNEALLRASG